ncbi:MAG TPA: low temperature requirement protein A [Trebonia sp.]|nr:low temperature requirement protein A [Trebonia sp.]
MAGQAAVWRRGPGDPDRETFLDLFFDLVFVFAMFQLSHSLLEHLRWSDAFQTGVLLLASWLLWNHTAAVCDRHDPHRPVIQVLVIGAMFGGFVLAAVLPGAFGGHGLAFATAYVAIQFGRPLFLAVITRGDERRREVRGLFWCGLSAIPWLAGGAVHGWGRAVLWAVAVAVDYGAIRLGWPTPVLGRRRAAEFAASGDFLGERHREFFIIALGEPVVLSGLTIDRTGFGAGHVAATAVALVSVTVLWRMYLYRAGQVLGEAVEAASDPLRVAIPAVYGHPVMVAGVVAISVGDELAITRPYGHIEPAWVAVILGGPAIFLVGRSVFEYAVFSRVSWHRVLGIIVLGAISPAMLRTSPLLASLAATLVLAGVAAVDQAHVWRHPGEPPRPPSTRPA